MKIHTIIILAVLFLTSCGDSYYNRKGVAFMDKNMPEKALEYFDKAIEKNPTNYDALLERGIVTSNFLDNDDLAVVYFTRAIEVLPHEPHAYYDRAESMMRQQKYAEALSDYNSALDKLIGSHRPLVVMGELTDLCKNLNLQDYNRLDPNKVFADRGVAYYYLDSLQAAYRDLTLAISNKHDLGYCFYWRGYVLLAMGSEEGCEDLRKASDLGYPDAKEAYENICRCRKSDSSN